MTNIAQEISISTCAPSGLAQPIKRAQAEQLALVLKALADPTRLQLLATITNSSQSEACVCDLADSVDLSQPTISHHLKVLTEVGLITREKRGTWAWYSVNKEMMKEISHLFDSISESDRCC
jgi:ArsR family transcriptional regulator